MFHQADHVIAEITEQPGGNGRQALGQVDPAFGDQRAQGVQRGGVLGAEGVGVKARLAVDLGPRAVTAPDQVGLHADHRIAAAHLAADLDTPVSLMAKLGEARMDHDIAALGPVAFKGLESGLKGHVRA
jgi:hypothetical protein